ncbi:enoyl-CoA hydratase-related protein [Gottfriedia acidiceleris]|uniref:Enoyl-CoA hydratase-related protein n=1 Tax=Gottfriedia acidiceleris TaxID=371036 RepID=A0ABY4JLL5_9BACI|nr:enoyl-CoA hydratase-related protein [Gottfriedia acidiceleris]UPM54084.1 enoyl-CoA hydratase-related protein [Gottfriedia acidiceleris]
MESSLLVSDIGHIRILTLNRTNAANSLSRELLDALHSQMDELKKSSVRAVIFTGSGSSYFCSGADLKERRGMTESEARETVEKIGTLFEKVERLPMPTIAAINGVALGGGLELALACDLRIAHKEAIVGLPETSLAIIPGAGGTQRLPRLIGLGRAKELIFTGKRLNALEAEGYGILEHVVEIDELQNQALEICETIASKGPLAIRAAKKAIQRGFDLPLDLGLRLETYEYETLLHTNDRMEGLVAFQEKRKPQYKGE